jgi:hypothetical protein
MMTGKTRGRGALFRFRFVPRLLGWFGQLAVVLHLIGIPLSMFIGYPSIPNSDSRLPSVIC